MTCETPATSMPRAATSVATSTSSLSSRNLVSAFSRATCAMSPCSGEVAKPRSARSSATRCACALGAGEDDDLAGVLGLQDPADDLGLVEVVGLVDELRGGRDHGRARTTTRRGCSSGAACGCAPARRSRPAWWPRTASSAASRASGASAARRRAGSRGRASRRPRRARARARGRGRAPGGPSGR